jgi:hypothetical protein
MNKFAKCMSALMIAALVLFLFVSPPALAKEGSNAGDKLATTAEIGYHEQFDANTIAAWMSNNGKIVDNDVTGGSGMEWPKGTNKTIDYASGLWVIGQAPSGELRTACAEYASEYLPGPINADGSPADPDDEAYRIYKINSDGSGDWDVWPYDQGAPYVMDENGERQPQLIGDQTLFWVMNDADATTHANLFNTQPMGLEVQTQVFGYNTSDPLGNVMFVKWIFINKSSTDYDSVYVAVWDDPDLGDAGDDLVGCDTTLGMGYCYNGGPVDATYGTTPPALGFDFFKGPVVDGTPLPMTSFVYYWNGAPDPYGDPEDALQTFNFMKGYASDGSEYTNDEGVGSRFVFSGDPVTQSGWLDSTPADRRFLMSSGPFTLAAGDTQEVVGAKIIAPGTDNLAAVRALRFFDSFAQNAFDNDFNLPKPPSPTVTATGLDDELVLVWSDDMGRYKDIESYEFSGYNFEGYNVYQGESQAGPWKRIATFDVDSEFGIVFDNTYDANTGMVLNLPVAYGSNSGLSRRMVVESDATTGLPIYNYSKYYFAVTSYAVNADVSPKVVESGKNAITVVPGNYLDVEATATAGETIATEHTAGPSDGSVVVEIVDPLDLTGHSYQVEFAETEEGDVVWHLKDTTTGEYKLMNETNQAGDDDYSVVDGLMVKVQGPPPGISSIVELDASGEVYDPNLLGSLNNYGRSQGWPTIAISGTSDTDPASIDRFGTMSPKDYEIKFTEDDSTLAWDYFTDVVLKDADGNPEFLPFTVHRIDLDGTRTRLTCCVYDMDTNGKWERTFGGIFGPAFEPLYIYDNAAYDPAKVNDYIAADNGTVDPGYGPWGGTYPAINRFTIGMYVDVDGYATEDQLDEDGYFLGPPAPGTWIKIITTKPNTPEDIFAFTSSAPNEGADVAKVNLEDINVVPNPYFGYNPAERTPTERIMRITNLPGEGATIRIFDLAGSLVKVIDDNERAAQGTQSQPYAEWDLRNSSDVPVASGMYLMNIEVDGVGSTTLKVAVVNRAERLLYY